MPLLGVWFMEGDQFVIRWRDGALVRTAAPILSTGETYRPAMKPGIEPPWPAKIPSAGQAATGSA